MHIGRQYLFFSHSFLPVFVGIPSTCVVVISLGKCSMITKLLVSVHLNPVPKMEDSLNSKKWAERGMREAEIFPPVTSFRWVQTGGQSQTLIYIKPVFTALVGESVAWKWGEVRNSSTFPSDILPDIGKQGKEQLHRGKPLGDDCGTFSSNSWLPE